MRKSVCVLILVLATNYLFGQSNLQQLITSSGNSFSNSTYQIDWSLGELQTATYTGNQQILTQGFHQSSYIITKINKLNNLQYDIEVFPNPTSDFITITVDNPKFEKIDYHISDLNGKILLSNKITDNYTINFSEFAKGTYFIILEQNNSFLKSFKIIKN